LIYGIKGLHGETFSGILSLTSFRQVGRDLMREDSHGYPNNTTSTVMAFNADGSRATLSAPTLPGTHTFSYSYDGAGRLTGVVNPTA
jgi:uncharacterized membrane protein